MPIRSIVKKIMGQHFLEDLKTDLEQQPDRIKRWYTDNFIGRSLSYLVGFTEGRKAVMLRATSDGRLKTAPSGSGLTVMVVVSGTTVNAYAPGQTHEWIDNNSYLDILVEVSDVTASIKQENGTWGPDFSLPVGSHDYLFVASGIKFKSRVGGIHGNYETIGMR